MHSPSKAVVAFVLTVASAGLGFGAVAPAQAATLTEPIGGCWRYLPNPVVPDLAAPGLADLSTGLEPWSADDDTPATLTLDSSGATVVGGVRQVSVQLTGGVVLDADRPVTGLATALLVDADDVDPTDPLGSLPSEALIKASGPVDLEAGDPLAADLTGAWTVPASAGRLALVGLWFDLIPTGEPGFRMACNGQTEGQPTVLPQGEVPAAAARGTAAGQQESLAQGVNPSTRPLLTGLEAAFEPVASAGLQVTDVVGQGVLDNARAGDTIVGRVSGMDSASQLRAQLCTTSDADCVGVDVTTDAQGVGTFDLPVSDTVPPGDGTLSITASSGGEPLATTPVWVLGAPGLTVAEKASADGATVTATVIGTSWDPGASVTLQPLADQVSGTDEPLTATVDGNGSFFGTLSLTDADVTAVRVTQARPDGRTDLEVSHDLTLAPAVAPVTSGDDTTGDSDSPSSTDGTDSGTSGSGDGSTATADTPVATPTVPADIPLPVEPPVTTVDGVPVPTAENAQVAVSEARLDGEASMGELFGGTVKRRVVFLVKNTGDVPVLNPPVRIGVGRSADIDPVLVATNVGLLQPGQQRSVAVRVELPVASIGTFRVIGQVGDESSAASVFDLELTVMPWGLVGLNVLGVAGVIAAVMWRRRRAQVPAGPAGVLLGDEQDPDGASVIDLRALGRWLDPTSARASDPAAGWTGAEMDQSESVVDLEAADIWWDRQSKRVS